MEVQLSVGLASGYYTACDVESCVYILVWAYTGEKVGNLYTERGFIHTVREGERGTYTGEKVRGDLYRGGGGLHGRGGLVHGRGGLVHGRVGLIHGQEELIHRRCFTVRCKAGYIHINGKGLIHWMLQHNTLWLPHTT